MAASLQRVAPCVQHTPPFRACLAHPSRLHRFSFAPCVTQTPPLEHTWYILRGCIYSALCHVWHKLPPLEHTWYTLQRCIVLPLTMCDTNSPLLSLILTIYLWLHCFNFAPCVIQISPLITWLLHPLQLHNSIFVPCQTGTSPAAAYGIFLIIMLDLLDHLAWIFWQPGQLRFRYHRCRLLHWIAWQ